MEKSEFSAELAQLVARRATAENLVDTLAFVKEIAERLEDDPVFGEFILVDYIGTGSRNRALKLHGYTVFDESDGSLGLVVGKWEEDATGTTLSSATLSQLSGWMTNFAVEAMENDLASRINEALSEYELALILSNDRYKIQRIRLHILTNLSLSSRFKEELDGKICGIPVERHVWDIDRLKALYESGREREPVKIALRDWNTSGIPCLEAARTNDLRSYLCIVKGSLLADLFDRFGSRLLEGNVRSFLGMTSSVNKGIRRTIQDHPSIFFAYNNGIAATASEAIVQDIGGQLHIVELSDLQIVNGGQTTAAILSARKKDQLNLEGVSVQLKLTVVAPANAQAIIPKIAEFANTQNKITAADFFANHPFHIKIEAISRRLLTPARAGQRIQSKWFYERSRGQFQNERLYLSKAERNAFELEYPTMQLLNKTDFAKYDHTLNSKPHLVSMGAQKNFSKFAEQFTSKNPEISDAEHWDALSPSFGEAYFKSIVAVAIMWKAMEKIVDASRGIWYEGGYRINIVTYTIAKIFYDLRKFRTELDLQRIWMEQCIETTLEDQFVILAKLVQTVLLTPPPGEKNVGEWCKKEACWHRVSELSAGFVPEMQRVIISSSESKVRKQEAKKLGILDDGIDLQSNALALCLTGYWMALHAWPEAKKIFSDSERSLLLKASTQQGFLKIGTDKDRRKLMQLQKQAEDYGFRH